MRLCSVALVLMTLASSARAEEDAKSLYSRGTALFALRKFSAAAAAYEQAFELKPDPAILYNAAQAHRLAGNKQRALELYQSVQRLYGSKIPPRAAVEIETHLRNLKHAIEVERAATGAPSQTPWPSTRVDEPVEKKPAPPPEAIVAPPPPEKRPVTKKAWFWGVIGGVAAVVVAGVVVGAVIGSAKTVAPTATLGRVQGD